MNRLPALHALRTQRRKALKDSLELRKSNPSAASLRVYIRGLVDEIRALDLAISYAVMHELNSTILEALAFYADPESYFAIGFFPDSPCGEFIEDFSDTDYGFKPGKKAREAMTLLRANLRSNHHPRDKT